MILVVNAKIAVLLHIFIFTINHSANCGFDYVCAPKEKYMNNQTIYYKPLPPQPATLLVVERGKGVKVVELQGTTKIGRACEGVFNDVSLSSQIVSRNHGEIFYEESEGVYYYKDNNSLNGTFFNGVKMEQMNERGTRAQKLNDGDVLRIDCENPAVSRTDAVIMIFSTRFSKTDIWKEYSLEMQSNVNIGRNIPQGISLTDFMVSRNHARLIKEQTMYDTIGSSKYEKWKIFDCGSVNGLAVNRETVNGERLLNVYDVINLANTTMIYLGDRVIYNEVSSTVQPAVKPRKVVMGVNIESVKVGVLGSLRKRSLLENIHLDVESGDFILILGGSGAGKTTFIKSLLGTIRREAKFKGQIMFDDMNLYKNYRMLKHKIGLVPQFSTTRDNDTVYNTIMDAANIKLAGEYTPAEIRNRVDEIIEKMLLGSLKNRLISKLSGGQKKRVEVAIQAIGDQEVFILDEPDSGMDVATRVELMSTLKNYTEDEMANLKACTENGGVVMVISHSPDDAADMFTKVIVLAKSKSDEVGHLAYYGTVENAYTFFGVQRLSEIVKEINYEGGKGLADYYIEKFENTRRG